MKKYFFLSLFLMLFVCGCHHTDSEQIADLAQWITYDQIVVGSTDVETVEALHGQPTEKDVFDNGLQIVSYEGYDLIVEDDIVKTIVIESSAAPPLWDAISIGDSLDTLLSVLPVAPLEMEYDIDFPPSELPESEEEFYCVLITTYEGDISQKYSKELLFVISRKYVFTFQIDTERDTITEIDLMGG